MYSEGKQTEATSNYLLIIGRFCVCKDQKPKYKMANLDKQAVRCQIATLPCEKLWIFKMEFGLVSVKKTTYLRPSSTLDDVKIMTWKKKHDSRLILSWY